MFKTIKMYFVHVHTYLTALNLIDHRIKANLSVPKLSKMSSVSGPENLLYFDVWPWEIWVLTNRLGSVPLTFSLSPLLQSRLLNFFGMTFITRIRAQIRL